MWKTLFPISSVKDLTSNPLLLGEEECKHSLTPDRPSVNDGHL